ADVVALACDVDCGHAACRMAVEYLDEMAAKIDGKIEAKARFKQNLRDYADTLAQPDQQELCVDLVSAAALAGEYAKIDLNEAPGKDKPGHIENLTLYLRCDVSEIVQSKSAGANRCTEAANAQ
ncbi:MAG: hypothetical protein HC927_13165, partial [Deltaproteobacteria bacterium]|nr:hypothetical protein [Deltaproteobacteria bacterium]